MKVSSKSFIGFFGVAIVLIILISFSNATELMRFKLHGSQLTEAKQLDVEHLYYKGIQKDVRLFRISGNKEVPIAIQWDDSTNKKIWFLVDHQETNEYVLRKSSDENPVNEIDLVKKDGNLTFFKDQKEIINYRFETTYPPAGVDSLYKRSAYLHPVWSPNGDVLSRIQPSDHYHHYGIWGPWTKTRIDGRSVDFWNLKEGQGTVKFESFLKEEKGPVFSEVVARQNHLDFGAASGQELALIEDLKIRVWNLPKNDTRYMIDYSSSFSTTLDNGILFEAYRYGGGIGFRANEFWNKKNSSVLTSEGKDRLTADGSNARWCIIKGEAQSDASSENGILFLSHPQNQAHPEPMRVWPIDANGGRGDMFFEFCPIRHEEWKIEKNKKYLLKYRMIVFNGDLSKEEAESYWKSFATNPEILN